jgi:hypothetical protein
MARRAQQIGPSTARPDQVVEDRGGAHHVAPHRVVLADAVERAEWRRDASTTPKLSGQHVRLDIAPDGVGEYAE